MAADLAVVFLISAQIQESKVSDAADAQLTGAGFTLTTPNTVLMLGSDARTKGTRRRARTRSAPPSRSDSILLMRVGGGANAQLSIPRDTVVDIPGHGRNKINAAYAIGGPSLAIETVEQYLGITINHLVEVNFENFPQLIDSLGGITYKGDCVVSKINGGTRNGGYTLRLKAGSTRSTASRRSRSRARARTSAARRRTTGRAPAASRRSSARSRTR